MTNKNIVAFMNEHMNPSGTISTHCTDTKYCISKFISQGQIIRNDTLSRTSKKICPKILEEKAMESIKNLNRGDHRLW